MPLYYEGYHEARRAIVKMTQAELLDYLDDLYGRDNLPEEYTLDDLAMYRYGFPYAWLTQAPRDSLDNIWTNNMSYLHPGQSYGQTIMDRLTEKQLDRWPDTANTARLAVVSGRTRFVERCLGCVGSGTSTNPYGSVWQGYQNAQNGDILLLRPGQYDEALTLNKQITLRPPEWARR